MNTNELKVLCKDIRRDILKMTAKAGSGHPGGSLSSTELLAVLYFDDVLRYDPADPAWRERDYFILSKGHVAPVLYSVLARAGFYSIEALESLRQFGSILQGHPHAARLPGCECSAGSLGQGLSISNGLALAFRKQGMPNRVYCLTGDGELQEGQVWEAVMTAGQHHLSQVCAIVDYNHVQLDDTLENIKALGDLGEKFAQFGWNVIDLDGHDVCAVKDAYTQAAACTDKPSVLIAHTVEGKGVSFMEHDPDWHGTAPNAEQLAQALAEIDAQ